MASGPKLVHKQFNSPIGLYSEKNIKETLTKHMTPLDNGSVGINFVKNQSAEAPPNLANSAVLRLLQEEERAKSGQPTNVRASNVHTNNVNASNVHASNVQSTNVQATNGYSTNGYAPNGYQPSRQVNDSWSQQRTESNEQNVDPDSWKRFDSNGKLKVNWPPAPEARDLHESQLPKRPVIYNVEQEQYEAQQQQDSYKPPSYIYANPSPGYQVPVQIEQQKYSSQKKQGQTGVTRIIPITREGGNYKKPSYQPPRYNYQKPSPTAGRTFEIPIQIEDGYRSKQSQTSTYESSEIHEKTGYSKLTPTGPGYTAASPSPSYRQPQSVSPNPPRRGWAPVQSPLSPQSNASQQTYPQTFSPRSQMSPNYPSSEPAYKPRSYEPPQTKLRNDLPYRQPPTPILRSNPAIAAHQATPLRGDDVWPPQHVKEAVAAENQARRVLAKSSACRPRKLFGYSLAELVATDEAY